MIPKTNQGENHWKNEFLKGSDIHSWDAMVNMEGGHDPEKEKFVNQCHQPYKTVICQKPHYQSLVYNSKIAK